MNIKNLNVYTTIKQCEYILRNEILFHNEIILKFT